MFLLNSCNNTSLTVLYVIKTTFNILKYVLPILCIIIFIKSLLIIEPSTKKEKEIYSNQPFKLKPLIMAVIFLIFPIIIENNILKQDNNALVKCYLKASIDNIDNYTETPKKEVKTYLQKSTNDQEEIAKAKLAKKAEQDSSKNKTTAVGGNSNISTKNDITYQNENKYFAPIQNINYSFGALTKTGGCSNEVYHDLPVDEGTPIYAGMEGIVTYYQYTCKNILYGYGNLAILRSGNGTYITYAHLSEFPEGINAKYTSSCQKRSDGTEPCPSTYCDSTMTRTYLGSKEVKRGQVIGYTGDTGNSTGPHLHVEIHENGTSVCVTDPFQAFGMR